MKRIYTSDDYRWGEDTYHIDVIDAPHEWPGRYSPQVFLKRVELKLSYDIVASSCTEAILDAQRAIREAWPLRSPKPNKTDHMRIPSLLIALLPLATLADEGRYVTVVAGPGETAVFEVKDSTTIQLVSLLPSIPTTGEHRAEVRVIKGKFSSWLPQGATIQGPFTLTLKGMEAPISAACTLRLIPQVFPPDKTVVIPPGQGAQITLQCSSNLVDWVTATNGIYTNVPSMKFFRIHSEKVP